MPGDPGFEMNKMEEIIQRLNEQHGRQAVNLTDQAVIPRAILGWRAMPIPLVEWLVQAAYDRVIQGHGEVPGRHKRWSPWILWDVCQYADAKCHTFVAIADVVSPALMAVSLRQCGWDVKGLERDKEASEMAQSFKSTATALCRRWGVRDPNYEVVWTDSELTNEVDVWVTPGDHSPVLIYCDQDTRR
jgi:hypothetical protein